MTAISSLLTFSFVYAFSINVVKLVILNLYSDAVHWIDTLLEFSLDFTFAVFIYACCLSIKSQLHRNTLLAVMTCMALIIEFLAFHYKLIFGRLPGADILFYITELNQLSSSLGSNLPLPVLLAELILTCLIFLILLKSASFFLPSIRCKKLLEAAGFLPLLVSLIVIVFPSAIDEKYQWSARHEILWLVQSYFLKEQYDLDKLSLRKEQFDQYLQDAGVSGSKPVINPDYPLCRFNSDKETANGRNVIILILEGVSEHELHSSFNGRQLMPNLQRIAKDNISFVNAYAAGSKSSQALTATFSGLPAHTSYNYLWTKPLLSFDGFPKKLRAEGYKSAYFHGSDLSFEQQRQYLQQIGFESIYEYDPDKAHQVYGWGYDDGTMFNELKTWIQDQKLNANQPYLASLFTLSSHDPYLLPDEWEPVFSEPEKNARSSTNWTLLTELKDVKVAAREAYHYLDHHLGEFYDWYIEHEKSNDTILLITGDHGSYLNDEQESRSSEASKFRVPLIIAGLDNENESYYQDYARSRIAGLHDIPATVMNLLGLNVHTCNLGVNLLAGDSQWPTDRLVYSVAGDALEKLYLWKNDYALLLDKSNGQFNKIDFEQTYIDQNDELLVTDTLQKKIDNIFKVNFYLLKMNRFFPTQNFNLPMKPVSPLKQPLFVSHRGNINGSGKSQYENSKNAIESAINSGFNWVEIDVQLTGDGIPILMHDPYITLPDGQRLDLVSTTYANLISIKGFEEVLTLKQALELYLSEVNLLIEVKAPEHISDILHLGREVARLITIHKGQNRIIVDSFNDELITSIKKQCNCETGLDAPFKAMLDKPALEYIKSMNMDWVYLHYSVVTPEVIEAAHNIGLRVMAYTVNDTGIIKNWLSTEMPDGIITDYLQVKEYFKQDNEPE